MLIREIIPVASIDSPSTPDPDACTDEWADKDPSGGAALSDSTDPAFAKGGAASASNKMAMALKRLSRFIEFSFRL
jgi:hypothetical protein